MRKCHKDRIDSKGRPVRGLKRAKVGQRFGRLKVLSDRLRTPEKGRLGGGEYLCLCKCGKSKWVNRHSLFNGATSSCGCLRSDVSSKNGYKLITRKGVTMSQKQWADQLGITESGFCRRLQRWGNVDRAFRHGYQHKGNLGSRILTHKGQSATVSQWSEIIGISAGAIHTRLGFGWPLEKVLSPEKYSQHRPITFKGKTMLVSHWEKELGFTGSTISQRLNKLGWSVEKALTTPVGARVRHFTYKGKRKSFVEWGLEFGVPSSTIHSRLHRGWSKEEALTIPVGGVGVTASA